MSLLMGYCLVIVAASMAGGLLPTLLRLNHTRMQLMMSFVSGIMLGVALYHLVPHSIAESDGDVDFVMQWLMAGLILMFMLLRLFHFHQHDLSGEDHDHSHPDDDCQAEQMKAQHPNTGNESHTHGTAHGTAHQFSWVGVGFGLAIHTLIDGVALGASFQVGASAGGAAGLVGIGVFLAIVLHKPLDAMTITSLMAAGGWSQQKQFMVNGAFSLMCPLGALLFFFGFDQLGGQQSLVIAAALAFSAGAFLCISLSDLLPEIQFHSHDRGKLTVALFFGIALAYSITFLEPSHAHEHSEAQGEEQHSVAH